MSTPTVPLRGIATVHLESIHEEGEEHGVLDLTADVRLTLTPVLDEEAGTLTRYDISMEGFTVDPHLRIGTVGQ